MRVLYNTCIADPWAKVAKKMQLEYGYEPVYWVGHDYDDSKNIIENLFPCACYQSNRDAWKGIFPKEIVEKAKECYIDIDFLKEISFYELQAIKMMDRLDYDRYSFNFMERERHFLNLLKNWTACFDIYMPDIVISAVIPHRIYDYVLYLICKKRNIKFICFQHSMCIERIYAVDNIYSIGNIFDEDYERNLQINCLSEDDLPVEIRRQYEKVMKTYSEARPEYMKAHDIMNKKQANKWFLVKTFLKNYNLFGKKGILLNKTVSARRKNRRYSLEDTKDGAYEMIFRTLHKQAYQKELRSFYSKLTSMPDERDCYIFFPLNYQPEATTSPAGDIFVNQRLCIEVLLKHTPNHYKIYVKEHPQQFMLHSLGHTGRIKEFYTDIISSSRVKLMPLELDPYFLMKNAKAVATVTGTVGWESIAHRKPVIVFGLIWYEKFKGVLRIVDEKSASKIEAFINSYQYDEQALLAYLLAFSKKSIQAYHYKGRKEKIDLSEDICVRNLIEEILRFTEKQF